MGSFNQEIFYGMLRRWMKFSKLQKPQLQSMAFHFKTPIPLTHILSLLDLPFFGVSGAIGVIMAVLLRVAKLELENRICGNCVRS